MVRLLAFASSFAVLALAQAQLFFVGQIVDFQGKCADLTQSSPNDFISITSVSCNGQPNQRWVFLVNQPPNTMRIQSELFSSSIFSYPSADIIPNAQAALVGQQAMAHIKASTTWNVTKNPFFGGTFNILDTVQGFALTSWDSVPNRDTSPLTLEKLDLTDPRQAFTLQ